MSALLIGFGVTFGVFIITHLMCFHGLLVDKLPRALIFGALVYLLMWVTGVIAATLAVIIGTRLYFGV